MSVVRDISSKRHFFVSLPKKLKGHLHNSCRWKPNPENHNLGVTCPSIHISCILESFPSVNQMIHTAS